MVALLLPGGRFPVALALLLAITLSSCADMDSFLFNTESVDRYHPPPSLDTLLEPFRVTSGGNELAAYRLRSNGSRPGLTILYCHGNKKNMDSYWDRVEYLAQVGGDVVTFDYRGFGLSEGESSEQGLREDAEAILTWIRTRGVPDDSIVVYGFSLGCFPAIHLAARVFVPRVLIVESPFASATSLVQGGAFLDFQERWLTDGRFDNEAAISIVSVPVLVIHGLEDDFIRYRDNGRLVYEAANEPKRLVTVAGAVHDNVPETLEVDRYVNLLRSWIDGP